MDSVQRPDVLRQRRDTLAIGKYEVTAGQYTAVLSAVAATDAYGRRAPGSFDGALPTGANEVRWKTGSSPRDTAVFQSA